MDNIDLFIYIFGGGIIIILLYIVFKYFFPGDSLAALAWRDNMREGGGPPTHFLEHLIVAPLILNYQNKDILEIENIHYKEDCLRFVSTFFEDNSIQGETPEKICKTLPPRPAGQAEIPTNCTDWYNGCNWCGVESRPGGGSRIGSCTLNMCHGSWGPAFCTTFQDGTKCNNPACAIAHAE